MHTSEHLLYFSCALIPPLLGAPAFACYWVGIHALLSPAASHSGFEDHWQGDLYHYIHHSAFNCNYGVVNIPWDGWFGTQRKKLGKAEAFDTRSKMICFF
jgi:lathosterol oxidase